MKQQQTSYQCDQCGVSLPTCDNHLEIMTSVSESHCWRRLHLRIFHRHGIDNNASEEPADLCQECAIALLESALANVKWGIRESAGVSTADAQMYPSMGEK